MATMVVTAGVEVSADSAAEGCARVFHLERSGDSWHAGANQRMAKQCALVEQEAVEAGCPMGSHLVVDAERPAVVRRFHEYCLMLKLYSSHYHF